MHCKRYYSIVRFTVHGMHKVPDIFRLTANSFLVPFCILCTYIHTLNDGKVRRWQMGGGGVMADM